MLSSASVSASSSSYEPAPQGDDVEAGVELAPGVGKGDDDAQYGTRK